MKTVLKVVSVLLISLNATSLMAGKSKATGKITMFNCDASTVQDTLNAGVSPIEIYRNCPALLSALYGKNYAGGKIAYLDTKGGSGFVVSPKDISAITMWMNFGRGYYAFNGPTQSGVFTGAANTAASVKAYGAPKGRSELPASINLYAAWLASKSNMSQKTDWALPSIDELSNAFQNNAMGASDCSACVQANGDSSCKWWSSTINVNINNNAFAYSYGSGPAFGVRSENIRDLYCVRAVRYFHAPSSFNPAIGDYPAAANVGDTITISGINFSTNPSDIQVLFYKSATEKISVTPSASTLTSISVQVPTGAISVPFIVKVGTVEIQSNLAFAVLGASSVNPPANFNAYLESVVSVPASNSYVVAVGGSGGNSSEPRILKSTDTGLSWTDTSPASSTTYLKAVGFGGASNARKLTTWGISGNMAYTSTDGQSWQSVSNFNSEIAQAVWCNDKYIAVTTGGLIASSSDGVSWSDRTSQAGGIWQVACNVQVAPFQYVSVGGTDGGCGTSSDGITWNMRNCNVNHRGVAWGGITGARVFAAVSNNPLGAYYSTDGGSNWTQASAKNLDLSGANFPATGLRAVAWNQTLGVFVAVGHRADNWFSSRDGKTWYKSRYAIDYPDTNDLISLIPYMRGFIGVGNTKKPIRLYEPLPN